MPGRARPGPIRPLSPSGRAAPPTVDGGVNAGEQPFRRLRAAFTCTNPVTHCAGPVGASRGSGTEGDTLHISRRNVLRGALAAAGVTAAAGLTEFWPRRAYALPDPSIDGTTLARTIV